MNETPTAIEQPPRADRQRIWERPIIMSGDNPRLILEGRKNQTRRIIKPQPETRDGAIFWQSPRYDNGDGVHYLHTNEDAAIRLIETACPYGVAGDRLWVREKWRLSVVSPQFSIRYCVVQYGDGEELYRYECDHPSLCIDDWNRTPEDKWRPSIHMPRWASRITLEITNVRVERLQDITAGDAKAEGIQRKPTGEFEEAIWRGGQLLTDERGFYAELWDSLHGKGAWDKNPWVWVIEFKLVA